MTILMFSTHSMKYILYSPQKSKYPLCVPSHFVAEQLLHLALSIILGFHALTGCNTVLPLSGKGKNTCWKKFIKYAHLLAEVVRDDDVDDAGAFVCSLYGIGAKGTRGNVT